MDEHQQAFHRTLQAKMTATGKVYATRGPHAIAERVVAAYGIGRPVNGPADFYEILALMKAIRQVDAAHTGNLLTRVDSGLDGGVYCELLADVAAANSAPAEASKQ